jgi:hypothetical protein
LTPGFAVGYIGLKFRVLSSKVVARTPLWVAMEDKPGVQIFRDRNLSLLQEKLKICMKRRRSDILPAWERERGSRHPDGGKRHAPPKLASCSSAEIRTRGSARGHITPTNSGGACACPGCRNPALGADRIYCAACEEEIHGGHCLRCGAPLLTTADSCPACGFSRAGGGETGSSNGSP